MPASIESPQKWRKRLLRFSIKSPWMGLSFAAGVAMTSFIAVLILARIAVTVMAFGMIGLGLASTSANATTTALASGDSEMRRTVLTQLKQSFGSQPPQTFDETTANWILPDLKQCQTDRDSEVVALANELVEFINANTIPPPP